MSTQIQLRRGLASEWASVNPVLAEGELGLETDTSKLKIGNGSSNWNSLDYIASGNVNTTAVQTITNKTLINNFEASVDLGSGSTIDITSGNYFNKTITQATTFNVTNVPTNGKAVCIILDLTNPGSSTITWWSNVKWNSGTAPTLSSSGRDILAFFTYNNGTTWNGFLLGKGMA